MPSKLLDRFVEVMLGKVGGDARSKTLLRRLIRAHHGLPQDLPGFLFHTATACGGPVAKAITDFGV